MRDKILQQTNGGLNIFTHYVGEIVKKKSFCNPFRGDKAPSCRLYYRKKHGDGIYYMVDYGDSDWCGDCFTIAAKVNNLNVTSDFPELLKTINKDLNLFLTDDAPIQQHTVMSKTNVQQLPSSGPLKFHATYQPFHSWEVKYWSRYGITTDILKKYHVSSLRSCTFTRQDGSRYTIPGTYLEPMYGYFFNDGKGVKVYRPFSKVRFMYAGELPKPYIFGMDELLSNPLDNDFVILTGGEKDVMTLAAHGFGAIALNSESAKVSESLMKTLSERFKHIIFAYDSDETGKHESAARVSEYSDRYPVTRLILPLSGTKKEKDVSDFFSMGNTASDYRQLIQNAITIK